MRELITQVDRLQRLACFEAAARLNSFSAAGRELGLAQPAVTRQIQALEKSVGVELFHRQSNRIDLTDAGRHLADSVDIGFDAIERAIAELLHSANTVVVAMPPGFAQQLVVPQLDGLQRALGDRDLRLWLYDRESELDGGSFDVAVRVGSGPWASLDSVELFAERVSPVAAPSLADAFALDESSRPEDVLAAPLLHMDAADRAWMSWSDWLAAFGLSLTPGRRRIEFNNYPAVLQQAVSGNGVALAWAGLTNELIEGGVLRVVGPEVASDQSYWATWHADRRTTAIDTTVEWLCALLD